MAQRWPALGPPEAVRRLAGWDRPCGRDAAHLDGIGIDAWGVDYALLDADHRVLGLPFHYRDRRTDGMVAAAHARVSRETLYARTGIQTMPINTIFQLMSEVDSPAARGAQRLAFVPDLLGLWMTGELVNEATIASTSGLLGAEDGRWARDLIARLGFPEAPFAHDPVESGTPVGTLLSRHDDACGEAAGATVWTVAGHDTASAFVAAPVQGPRDAVLSSGTWSLIGTESDRPFLDAQALEYNLTNERGMAGRTRLLRNVMGLWLLQECRRGWERAGTPADYDQLMPLAEAADPNVALFDPDDEALLAPGGDMAARVREACTAGAQAPPNEPGEIVRSIFTSLACKYRFVLERLQRVTGTDVRGAPRRRRRSAQSSCCASSRPTSPGCPCSPVRSRRRRLGTSWCRRSPSARWPIWRRRAHSPPPPGHGRDMTPRAANESDELYERFLSVTGLGVNDRDDAVA